jgi:hypothetical protein
MKRLLSISGFLPMLLLASQAAADIPIRISPDTYNFGKIVQHAVATKRFWIVSTADKPVKVSHVIPDCGCTTLILLDSTIAPGDSVVLDAIFHSRSFIGFIAKRPSVKIEGNENDNAFVKFYAEVMVRPELAKPLVLAPDKVDVSQFGEKPRRKGTFTFTNKTIHDYTITVIDSSYKSFDIKLPNKIKAGETIEGQVIVRKDKIETDFEEAFTIELNDDGRTRYSVPIIRMYEPKQTSGSLSGK